MNLKEHIIFVHPNWYDSARKMIDLLLSRVGHSFIQSKLLFCLKSVKRAIRSFTSSCSYLKLKEQQDKSERAKSKRVNSQPCKMHIFVTNQRVEMHTVNNKSLDVCC